MSILRIAIVIAGVLANACVCDPMGYWDEPPPEAHDDLIEANPSEGEGEDIAGEGEGEGEGGIGEGEGESSGEGEGESAIGEGEGEAAAGEGEGEGEGEAAQPSGPVDAHVDIFIANDCTMAVDPESFTISSTQTLFVDWHNHSADFPVDVWMSYGGGFTELPPGATWNEPIEHCFNVNPYVAYADIETACSSFRVEINCE